MADPFTLIRIVDVESTGLDDPAEMVELGHTDIRFYPGTGWQIDSEPQSWLVNPGMPVTFPAMAVHHISQAEAETGMVPDEARRLIVAGADVLCAHNAAFDSRFIRGHNLPWICTFKCTRTAWPDMQSHGNGSIRYEHGLCLGDPRTEPSHRAGPDTWVTAHILIDLLKVYSPEQMMEITSKPVLLTKMPIGEHFGKPFADVPAGMLEWCLRKLADDPAKEDLIHTARLELKKRAAAMITEPSAYLAQEPKPAAQSNFDPNAWRKEMERF